MKLRDQSGSAATLNTLNQNEEENHQPSFYKLRNVLFITVINNLFQESAIGIYIFIRSEEEHRWAMLSLALTSMLISLLCLIFAAKEFLISGSICALIMLIIGVLKFSLMAKIHALDLITSAFPMLVGVICAIFLTQLMLERYVRPSRHSVR